MLYYQAKGRVSFLHVNSVSQVKFTFLQESHSKIKNKMTNKHDIFVKKKQILKNLHFRRTINFIEERVDMRRKLFVDTILSRIRSIIALIPQFVYPSVQKNRWVESTDQVQTVSLTGRSDNLWHNNVFMFQTERESPSCLNTPWI